MEKKGFNDLSGASGMSVGLYVSTPGGSNEVN